MGRQWMFKVGSPNSSVAWHREMATPLSIGSERAFGGRLDPLNAGFEYQSQVSPRGHMRSDGLMMHIINYYSVPSMVCNLHFLHCCYCCLYVRSSS